MQLFTYVVKLKTFEWIFALFIDKSWAQRIFRVNTVECTSQWESYDEIFQTKYWCNKTSEHDRQFICKQLVSLVCSLKQQNILKVFLNAYCK